ncbi:MAG: signal peptidase II [Endomicrobium sp.]|jgi:signal peptidase II|nr:signal peptidase II [Endomicrobium sp.]
MISPQFLGITILIFDQISKFIINSFIPSECVITVIPIIFNITNIKNNGTVLGILHDINHNFSIVIFIILLSALLFVYKNWAKIRKNHRYAFCFIISGGISNLLDRIFRGAVIDFFDFGVYLLRCPCFNIADLCIFIAIIFIFFDVFFKKRKHQS